MIAFMNAHPRLSLAVMLGIAGMLFYLTIRRAIHEDHRHRAIFGTRRGPRRFGPDSWQ